MYVVPLSLREGQWSQLALCSHMDLTFGPGHVGLHMSPSLVSFPCRWGCAWNDIGEHWVVAQPGHPGEHPVLQKHVAKKVFPYGFPDVAFHHTRGLDPESAHHAPHS